MTRVSENSSYHAIGHSVGKTKAQLEDLQIKGSNLRRVQKPSDDPVGNIDILTMRSRNVDSEQYLRNANYAKTQLSFTESALEELTEIVTKAKEIAIGQASNLYAPEVRQSIAKEVEQLREQSLAVANRRIGNRYIFAGHKTLTRPFDENGQYFGDQNKMQLEINKDYFVPINMAGDEVFFASVSTADKSQKPLKDTPLEDIKKAAEPKPEVYNEFFEQRVDEPEEDPFVLNRNIASAEEAETRPSSLFEDLQTLINALETNNFSTVQSLLPKLDQSLDRLVLLRAKVGSIDNAISNAEMHIEKSKLQNETYRSKIEDADVAELFSNLARQKNVLEATYKASANLMNQSLLNFVK